MARARSSGPKRIVRKLSDGTTWAYFYDRTTGLPVGKEQVLAGAEARPGSLAAVIAEYRASPQFHALAPRTRESYAGTLDFLKTTFGDLALHSITPGMVQTMKEELQHNPWKANQVIVMLSIVSKRAVSKGLIPSNPAAGAGHVPTRPRIQIWSREEEARRFAPFRKRVKLLGMLMLYTLQRMSDVLEMTTAQVSEQDGRLWIIVRQHKTDELVGVPVHKVLEPLIRERLEEDVTVAVTDEDGTVRQVKSLLLVPSPRGLQWTRRNASRAWDHDQAIADAALAQSLKEAGWSDEKIAEDLKKRHRQRRDLRRTGIVRLAECGATIAQIAGISGHSVDYCLRILDTYLPRRTEVALGGIEAWEAAEKAGPRVIRLADSVVLEIEAKRRRERA